MARPLPRAPFLERNRGWILISLFFFSSHSLLAAGSEASDPKLKQEFREMFARSYYPGRSGQILVVPRRGDIITRDDPHYRFMHGSPWDYDTEIPLLFYGPGLIRAGDYGGPAHHQDIVPTLAGILRLPVPPTVTGRNLQHIVLAGATPPRAIVVVVLDALRRDYFDRFSHRLPTLGKLRLQGAWFSEARVNYLPTATAVAHSTIATGSDPRFHGINVNSLFDRSTGGSQDPYAGMSPRNLMALTLADLWNLQTDGRAVVISQGSLPYAAVALAGHGGCLPGARPTIAVAYNRASGKWETNPECFRLPDYVAELHSREIWEKYGGNWQGREVANPDEVRRTPFFAEFEVGTLRRMMEREKVGEDEITDLILVNLKTPDFVGHQYGPDSPQIQETLAVLDAQVADLVSFLEENMGGEGYLLVLTADHGMPSAPVAPSGRHFADELVQALHRKFDPAGKLVLHYESSNSQLYVDRSRLNSLGIELSQIKEYLESQPFIFAAFTEEEVQAR